MSLLAPQRLVALDGPLNFRDMGGYHTTTGRTTRWRTLFRADGLQTLTAQDLTVLQGYDLRTVLDLRSKHELDARGQFPTADMAVIFHNLPVIDETWDKDTALQNKLPVTEFLHMAYRKMLADAGTRFADALRLLAAPDALPAVFHCAAGKDRTGLLAGLVLGALNVEREQIVADYALTGECMDEFVQRVIARDPESAARVLGAPKAFFAAEPEAMRRTLAELDAEHGSIANYLRLLGLEQDVLDRLAETLLV
jgi:protein-tyrosine phosphatase